MTNVQISDANLIQSATDVAEWSSFTPDRRHFAFRFPSLNNTEPTVLFARTAHGGLDGN